MKSAASPAFYADKELASTRSPENILSRDVTLPFNPSKENPDFRCCFSGLNFVVFRRVAEDCESFLIVAAETASPRIPNQFGQLSSNQP